MQFICFPTGCLDMIKDDFLFMPLQITEYNENFITLKN